MSVSPVFSEQPLSKELPGCGLGIPDRSRLVGLPVVSNSPEYGDNLMAFDGGTSDFHREPDDGRDADMDCGRGYAWSMDHSAGLLQHDGSMDPWCDDPSWRAVGAHRNRSVDNRRDASEESPKEAPLHHSHLVLYHHFRGRWVADDCHWHRPLLECNC